MAPKPRPASKEVPDSVPKPDQGSDVLPDERGRTQQDTPDSLPPTREDNSPDGGGGGRP